MDILEYVKSNVMSKEDLECYEIISEFYGDRTAKRSGVRLMNHIDEGLVIL